MSVPNLTFRLANLVSGVEGYTLLPDAAGDLTQTESFGLGGTPFIAGIADLDGDGVPEVIVGAPGSDDKANNAGRIFVAMGTPDATAAAALGHGLTDVILDGVVAGDLAGMVVASIADLNGDGKADMLIGAPGAAAGGAADAGIGYVAWGASTTGIDLADVNAPAGGAGFGIRGEAAGDAAGSAMAAIADLTGDGRQEVLIGATGNDAGGTDAGAAYVVFGKNTTSAVLLTSVAAGTGGYKIIGENAGDQAGMALAAAGDMNGDGKSEILVGAAWNDGGGADAGAAYVVFGKSTTTAVNLDDVAAGTGGFKIVGADAGALAGAMLAAAGDLNGDGRGDILLGAPGDGEAFVVFGKADGATVNLADVEAGIGGFAIHAEAPGDLTRMSLAAGTDLNRDGIADLVIGAPGADGGDGAVYVIWGGGTGTVDLAQIALSHGGAKVFGLAGGHTGASVAIGGDMNGDGTADLIIASTAAGVEQVTVLYTPADWQPDTNVYGSDGAEVIGPGFGAVHKVGDGTDHVFAFGGDDQVSVAGGDDSVEAGTGNDTVDGGLGNDTLLGEGGFDSLVGGDGADSLAGGGNADILEGGDGADTLDGGLGADAMAGGVGNDLYLVDDAGDVVTEAPGEGTDTVRASVDTILADGVDDLVLTGAARAGTGNALDNHIAGTTGDDILDGAAGNDTMTGGAGNDLYIVDSSGDLVVDAGGFDTIQASANVTMAGGVEALELTAPGHVGVGNLLDNLMSGSAGSDTLNGGKGNDTLDGGQGADRLIGGAGDDLFRVDNPGDVVVELVAGGNDTVEVSGDWTIAANIETVVLVGAAAHKLTGNVDNNGLVGSTGNDTLDGGLGDDSELGGAGDDELVSSAGADTLAGGAGNDRYVVKGGHVHIEDQLGDDTLDASGATGDSYIDLSGDTASEIEKEVCDIGQGGSTALPLDVQFLQDVTGSFADDIANVRLLVPNIVAALQAVQPDAEFGVSTFRDKAVSPFGNVGDWVYQQVLGLSTNTAALTAAYTAMVASNGNDEPEAQLESLMQLALHTADVGFRATSARFVVLFTDAPFHNAGDGALGGITTPNNGDAVMAGSPAGTGEDYPFVAQVKAALEAANIIPIFAVANGAAYEAPYDTLVTDLGRGTVVSLSTDSANIVSAITNGLNVVTQTHIENAVGGAGNDTLKGSDLANGLQGGTGDDSLDGGLGSDTMDGGAGNDHYVVDSLGDVIVDARGIDTVVAGLDWTLALGLENLELTGSAANGTGNGAANRMLGDAIANLLNGVAGNDTLDGAEGNDTLLGGNGNDSLLGGIGDDSLAGGAGDDVLVGGAGLDKLSGGTGADEFRFLAAGDKGDRIQDFVSGTDSITLSAAGFGFDPALLGQDLQAAGHLAFGTAATAPGWQVVLDTVGGRIYFDADGAGGAAKVLLATLTGAPAIAASDVHVIA